MKFYSQKSILKHLKDSIRNMKIYKLKINMNKLWCREASSKVIWRRYQYHNMEIFLSGICRLLSKEDINRLFPPINELAAIFIDLVT
jgi:hypothetical protein